MDQAENVKAQSAAEEKKAAARGIDRAQVADLEKKETLEARLKN